MIFAAGFGTRMGHLTKQQPKPLIKVAGMPLIDRALGLMSDIAPPRTVVNLHYLPDMLEAHLQDRPVITVREEPDILETGGGLRNALPLLNSDPVLTLNPDVIWIGQNPLQVALDAWDPADMDALLVCIPETRVHGRDEGGDFHIDDGGKLHRGGDLVYGGVQIMKTARLHDVQQPAFSLNVVWNEMAKDGRLHGVIHPGHWCDVGRPDGIGIAEDMLRQHHV
ncbi:nucleotidyltransferase family protein [Tateyamaria sp. ANG-S1]|uniref:nucleotidyltransferase family protein n=1 Tax=Tateyamaria sp. ANG-S1 TaxID=1577905 RepID=UPI00057F4EAD|nr:nucleotidyltransferase family protein [Tateyamaria sp. ANG-S1]KIC49773.1 nucleotidyltransferase [Tateyamaria sp. ANG-S1]